MLQGVAVNEQWTNHAWFATEKPWRIEKFLAHKIILQFLVCKDHWDEFWSLNLSENTKALLIFLSISYLSRPSIFNQNTSMSSLSGSRFRFSVLTTLFPLGIASISFSALVRSRPGHMLIFTSMTRRPSTSSLGDSKVKITTRAFLLMPGLQLDRHMNLFKSVINSEPTSGGWYTMHTLSGFSQGRLYFTSHDGFISALIRWLGAIWDVLSVYLWWIHLVTTSFTNSACL